jgi:hypothetical protein
MDDALRRLCTDEQPGAPRESGRLGGKPALIAKDATYFIVHEAARLS